MICQDQEPLIAQICALYERISSLESLKPSTHVDTLFTKLVLTCMPPNPIDVNKLCKRIQDIRSHLIKLCGQAEGLLESHFSTILASYQNPLKNLDIFPYYSNYIKLSKLEFDLLSRHLPAGTGTGPRRIAFVGSGPLPLTSIVLARDHLTEALFDNYDVDPRANAMASALVASDPDIAGRMSFRTTDIMDVRGDLGAYDVVFLAALVGMDKAEKARVVAHLARHMARGATLMLRSAHGARAFLYPVVDPRQDLDGFEVLSVYHPTDEVINSVVVARKHGGGEFPAMFPVITSPAPAAVESKVGSGNMVIPTKCCHEIQYEAFNPLNIHGNMVEELAFEDKI